MRRRRRSSPPGAIRSCATPIGSMPGFTRCWCGRAIAKRRQRPLRSLDVSVGLLELSEPDRSLDLADRDQLERDLPGSMSISDRSSSCTTTSDCAWMRWPRSPGHPAPRPIATSPGDAGDARCARGGRPTRNTPRRDAGMTTNDPRSTDVGALLTAWFEVDAPTREPDGLVDAALARTARTRPLPAWLPERWIPMQLHDAATDACKRRPDPRGSRAPRRPCRRAPADRGRSARSSLPLPDGLAGNGRLVYVAAATSSAPTTVGSTSGP